jgi:hypothetical protein
MLSITTVRRRLLLLLYGQRIWWREPAHRCVANCAKPPLMVFAHQRANQSSQRTEQVLVNRHKFIRRRLAARSSALT